MPDHTHVLVKGLQHDSDFLKWLDLWRQLSGYWVKRRSAQPLWQEGYWDYTLRDDDPVPNIASYIIWNPVAAGLVAKPEDYEYSGSETTTVRELALIQPVKPKFGDI